ncbi:oxidoreductase [Marisediminicola sp. LYQ134]|uniref:oxidoreductase n=1 Tax=Marisediminicola sp. LYQ134 TaxID=3391061 RepID=UPI003982FB07
MISALATLDRTLGRVTMYRLVTLVLAALALISLGLSALGMLPYAPLDILASGAVAIASTLVASRVMALLFRTRPHVESSLITALLVFFLFWPSSEPRDLAVVALASALATASKYVVAWRRRHILNPAAAGAMIVALLGFDSAVWWVATAAMLPFVVVGAALVLHRVRRFALAGVFIVASASILVGRLAWSGSTLLDATATAFVSYPIVFFAAFMLSEPLTLPPRRWQQLALAALVGALFGVVGLVFLGPVSLSFEMALVIGNIAAFAAGQRRRVSLRYVGRDDLTPTAARFTFAPAARVPFRAGQYIELTLPHDRADARGSRRVFTLSSAPGDDTVSVSLRMNDPSSSFKRTLAALRPGASVSATQVAGDFVLPRDEGVPVLLVARGIGVTPFVSQLADDRGRGRARDSVLVYEVASLRELAFSDELAEHSVVLVSPSEPQNLPATWRWAGAGPIDIDLLRREVPDAASRRAFVSGAPAMVTATAAALRRLGASRVTTDHFAGY